MDYLFVVKIKSQATGHNCYNYKYTIGREPESLREPGNQHNEHAVFVHSKKPNKRMRVIGHIFDTLAKVVYEEAVVQRCSLKKVYKILQISQANACLRVSFLIKLPRILLKKRLWHRCFPVNFAKFLRTAFFIEHFWWLLLFMD